MKKTVCLLISILLLISFCQFVSGQEAEEKKDSEKSTEKAAEKPSEKSAKEACDEKAAIQLKEIEPFSYAAVEMKGSYEQHEEAFNTLYQAVSAQGLPMDQAPFGIYYDNPETTPEENLTWEVGVPIPEGTEVKEPLKLKKWELTKLGTCTFEGVYGSEENMKVYQDMFQWMAQNQYTMSGPFMEKYLSEPTQDEEGNWCGKIKIIIPVEKAKEE